MAVEASSPRRRRRSSEEIRRLLLDAARECFAEGGYAGATTKEIARRAGVAEPLLFRAFESKEKLFETAVLQPFDDFLDEFAERWLSQPISPDAAPESLVRQLVEQLYDLVVAQRDLFRAMARDDLVREGAQPAIAKLEAVGERLRETHGLAFDPHIAARITVITIVATAHFGDALFAGTAEREAIVDQLVHVLVGAALYVPQ